MQFEEYPKALYRAGQMLAVSDAIGEAQARRDGYDDWADDHARANGEPAQAAEKADDVAPAPEPAVPAKRKYTRKTEE